MIWIVPRRYLYNIYIGGYNVYVLFYMYIFHLLREKFQLEQLQSATPKETKQITDLQTLNLDSRPKPSDDLPVSCTRLSLPQSKRGLIYATGARRSPVCGTRGIMKRKRRHDLKEQDAHQLGRCR